MRFWEPRPECDHDTRGAHLGRYDEPRVDLLGLVEAPEEGLDAPRVADVPDPSLRDLIHDGRRGWAAVPAGKWGSRRHGCPLAAG